MISLHSGLGHRCGCFVLSCIVFYTGYIAISGDVILTLNRGPSPPFTLTCISTGGPATTVTWTRDFTTVTEGNETVLNDPETAQYTHTLTVRGRLGGVYKCMVENNKSSKTNSLTVDCVNRHIDKIPTIFMFSVASAPTNLTSEVQSDYTSVVLSWIPPNPLNDTTGYRISYTGGTSNGMVNVSGGSTNNTTLNGLEKGGRYNISIVGTSEHLFSESVWRAVELSLSG